MGMDFPARHDRSSLNCRPGMLACCTSTCIISVAVDADALAGMIVGPGWYVWSFVLREKKIVAFQLDMEEG